MSIQTIEIALPSDLIEQIDAEVGPERRSEFIADLAKSAVGRRATVQPDEVQSDLPPASSRFNPVPIKGEPASVTLLRDRGSY